MASPFWGGRMKFGELCAGQEKERTSADVVRLGGGGLKPAERFACWAGAHGGGVAPVAAN